jgi:hypothetical protein
MKKQFSYPFIFMLLMSITFLSCKKDNEADTDITTVEDQSQGEMTFDLVYSEVNEAAEDLGLKKGGFPIVSVDSSVSPITMTIDYGTSNYLCKDGNLRRGVILVKWTGAYRKPGTKILITFDKFYQNNNLVEGEKSILNNGYTTKGQFSFTIEVSGKITTPSAETFTWKSNRTRYLIDGLNTATRLDDVYEITGSGSGINRKGVSFTSEITKSLKVVISCTYKLVSGIIEVKPENRLLRTIDFGTGLCDELITITVNGKTRTIPRRK